MQEVKELINLKGFISINDELSFETELTNLLNNKKSRDKMGQINYRFIKENLGATKKVISYLKQKK